MKPKLYDQDSDNTRYIGLISSNPITGRPSRGERDTSDRFYTLENQGLHGDQGSNAMNPRLDDAQIRRNVAEVRRGLYEGREHLLGELAVPAMAEVIELRSRVATDKQPAIQAQKHYIA